MIIIITIIILLLELRQVILVSKSLVHICSMFDPAVLIINAEFLAVRRVVILECPDFDFA